MRLIDTHAHLHFEHYRDDYMQVIKNAVTNNVVAILCVGTSLKDSQAALAFAQQNTTITQLYATAGIHPHEAASDSIDEFNTFVRNNSHNIVAIGECGLDYYRTLAAVDTQKNVLRAQIEIAQSLGLPLIFHVRDAWKDFFEIIADYPNIRAVIHSFTGGVEELNMALKLHLTVALNGIITFTKLPSQLNAAKKVPLSNLLLETDCPYLSPTPLRGKRNEPANVSLTAAFLAKLRAEPIELIAEETTKNAQHLFSLTL